jgi:hypothetical protein
LPSGVAMLALRRSDLQADPAVKSPPYARY